MSLLVLHLKAMLRGGLSALINHRFHCDSEGIVYLISCKRCELQYVGTITPFRLRFNNHKSASNRYGRWQRNICGQQLYAHFWGEEHSGLSDFLVQVIDVTDVNNPTERERFWRAFNYLKFNSYVPRGLNLREAV
jgi:hypothetical protein